MTSSRSTASTSSWVQLALALLVGCLVLAPTRADAGGRKRVVVLELEGPKAEKFHEDLVKLIKKTHTVVPLEKWSSTADDMDASSPTDKNIKKVAKKLKVDAVITGKIDKRRDEYIIKLKLREGKTGESVGSGFDTKAEGPRIDGKASRDLKDELIEAIGNLDANRSSGGGDDEEEEDKPVKKKPIKKDEEEEEEEEAKPVKKGFSRKDDEEEDKRFAKRKPVKKDEDEGEEEEEAKPVKKGFSRKDDEEVAALKTKKDVVEDEEETPLPKATKKKPVKVDEESDEESDEDSPKKKKVAANSDEEDEDGGSVEEEADVETASNALSPGERAVDAIIGLSFNARRMAYTYSADLGPVGNGTGAPPPYKGVPVAGLLIDATIYPLAIGHKRKGIAKNFGATVMVDKVLKISSKAGSPPVTLPTSQMRYAIGAAFRYPLGKLTVAATLRYGQQTFTITPAMGVTPDIPNVSYTIIDPAVGLRYQVAPKVLLGLNLGFMLLTNTGQIQKSDQYGLATVSGFEGELGGDYLIAKNIFARAAFKFETIGFKFRGGAAKTNLRDGASAPDQDVFGARDSYFGGAVSVGYLY